MRTWWVVLLCGCRAIFGLDQPSVIADAPPDVAVVTDGNDAMMPQFCFGRASLGMMHTCVDLPTNDQTYEVNVDTGASQLCEASITSACVILARTLTVGNGGVHGYGTKPLILVGVDGIVVDGVVDVSSSSTQGGAGTGTNACAAGGTGSTTSAGGGGGGFGTAGARGGNSASGSGGTAGATATAMFHAGCDGGTTALGATKGGVGGGAVALISSETITFVASTSVRANGAGGPGGAMNILNNPIGGGGGGAGGFILIDAPTINADNNVTLFANGGGGGAGGNSSQAGAPGNVSTAYNLTGRGGMSGGGRGGDGAAGGDHRAAGAGLQHERSGRRWRWWRARLHLCVRFAIDDAGKLAVGGNEPELMKRAWLIATCCGCRAIFGLDAPTAIGDGAASTGGDGPVTLDASSGALCFGRAEVGIMPICIDTPVMDLDLGANLQTNTDSRCGDQDDACVVIGKSVKLDGLTAVGTKPLIVIGTESVTIAGLVDVSTPNQAIVGNQGAGAGVNACMASGGGQTTSGGGGGGSFSTVGGNGGKGLQGTSGTAAATLGVTFHAGCSGGGSGGGMVSGGFGGGAIAVFSSEITLSANAQIRANGEGGGAGLKTVGMTAYGGGGGGAGGFVLLDAATFSIDPSFVVFANGGGGGGGGGTSDDGIRGGVSTAYNVSALGGQGNPAKGGNGAASSLGAGAGENDSNSGGAGGGGGEGYVVLYGTSTAVTSSPIAIERPH
ncbi:MAG: hypothetical protein QM831_33685 [Kofleriaceae bacterium]